MAFVNTIDIMGEQALTDAFVTGTLEEYRDDSVTQVGVFGLGYNYSIKILDFPNLTNISSYGAFFANAITAFILRGDTVCNLEATTAFQYSGISNGKGYVYVKDSLLDTYKSATNWSTYADRIKPLSELGE